MNPAASPLSVFDRTPVGHRVRVKEPWGRKVLVRSETDAPWWLPNPLARLIDASKLRGDRAPVVVVIGRSESGSTRWIGTGGDRRTGRY